MNNFEQFINKLKNIKLTQNEKFVIRQNIITSISLGSPKVKSPYFLAKVFRHFQYLRLVPVIILLIVLSSFSLPGILKNYEVQKVFNQDSKELEQFALETDDLENDLDVLEIEIELDELEKSRQELDAIIL